MKKEEKRVRDFSQEEKARLIALLNQIELDLLALLNNSEELCLNKSRIQRDLYAGIF